MIFKCDLGNNDPIIQFPLPPLPEHHICFYGANPIAIRRQEGHVDINMTACILVGPNSKMVTIKLARKTFLIRVIFQPGALYRILGIPLTELHNFTSYNAPDILGNEIQAVNEQLANTTNDTEAIQIVENYIFKKAKNAKSKLPVDDALSQLLKHAGTTSISELASYSCLSNRQFERLCLERTGFSPKFFSKQARFAKAWIMKENNPDCDWTTIAHACSYFDQMHLIKDFKQFTGITPSTAFKEMNAALIEPKNRIVYE